MCHAFSHASVNISIHTLTQRVTDFAIMDLPFIAISIHTLTQRVTVGWVTNLVG